METIASEMLRLLPRKNKTFTCFVIISSLLFFSLFINFVFLFRTNTCISISASAEQPAKQTSSLQESLPFYWKFVQLEVERFKRDQLSKQQPQMMTNQLKPSAEQQHEQEWRKSECEPRRKVGFLKTHKTGSSTIFSILSRFAVHNELLVAVPNKVHLGSPHQYRDSNLLPPRLRRYDMLFNHVIFSDHARHLLPPAPESYWFTILRDPLDTYISVYKYFRIDAGTGVPFEEFARDPEYYLDVMDANGNLGVSNRMAARGRNLQFDLGMDLNSSAEQIISFMEAHFDSVLIAEVLDSSLAQLASQLCWPLSSVTYFPQNQRSQRESLSREERTYYHRQFAPIIDTYSQVYRHFLRRQQFYFYHFNLSQPAQQLRRLNNRLRRQCLLQAAESQTPTQQHTNTNINPNFTKLNNYSQGPASGPGFPEGLQTEGDDEVDLQPSFQPVRMQSHMLKRGASFHCRMMSWPESTWTEVLKFRHKNILNLL